MSEHGHCPSCAVDLNGGLVWDTLRAKGHSEAECDRIAAMYGATRSRGRWGRALALYSQETDRTFAWRCPDCHHQWPSRPPAESSLGDGAGYGTASAMANSGTPVVIIFSPPTEEEAEP